MTTLAMGSAGCRIDRERPTVGTVGPEEPPSVAIVSPQMNTTVPTPGELLVSIEVGNTFRLLDRVSATVVRFANDSVVARGILDFSPPAGDTIVTLGLELDTFPDNTQLNLTATAAVSSFVATSEEVAVIALDCSEPQVFCP